MKGKNIAKLLIGIALILIALFIGITYYNREEEPEILIDNSYFENLDDKVYEETILKKKEEIKKEEEKKATVYKTTKEVVSNGTSVNVNVTCKSGEYTYLSCNSKSNCGQYAKLTNNDSTENDPKKVIKTVTTLSDGEYILKKTVQKTNNPKIFEISFNLVKNNNNKNNDSRFEYSILDNFDNNTKYLKYVLNEENIKKISSNKYYVTLNKGNNGSIYYLDSISVGDIKLENDVKVEYVCENEVIPETKINPKEIVIKDKNITLNEGTIYDIDANVIPNDAYSNYIFYSSNKSSVCTVKDGIITAKKEGKCVVSLSTVNNIKQEIKVTVNKVKEIDVNIDTSYKIDNYNSNYKYISSNTKICTVNKDTVKTLKNGICNISVKDNNNVVDIIKYNVKNFGLIVSNDGKILLNGIETRMMGVNAFSVFSKHLSKNIDTANEYKKEIDTLAKYNIPFIRLPICTWSQTYLKKYDSKNNNKDKYNEARKQYLEKVLDVINYAESKNIGIIIDFFWYYESLPSYEGESVSDLGNPNSKSVKVAKEYVKDIINLVKGKKSVWGYEIGNEYNLTVDLFPSSNIGINVTYPKGDKKNAINYYTTNEMVSFYKEISKTIRQYDKYRMISTGDAAARIGAYSAYQKTKDIYTNNHKKWSTSLKGNSKNQIKTIIKKYNSGEINTISTHLYKYDLSGKIGNFKDYLNFYVEIAKEIKKPVFLGEFSGNLKRDNDSLDNYVGTDIGYNQKEFDSQVKAVTDVKDVQLSAVWMFNRNSKGYIVSDKQPKDKHRFEKIVEFNKKYKNDIESYWK